MNFKKKNNNSYLTHWVIQKVTALVLLPLLCWFLYIMKSFVNKDYKNKIFWLQESPNSFLLALFMILAIYHSQIGLSNVIEDYVQNKKSKTILLMVKAIFCLLLGVFTIIVIFALSVGFNV